MVPETATFRDLRKRTGNMYQPPSRSTSESHLGAEVGELSEVARAAAEAEQGADAVPPTEPPGVCTITDTGLPELFYSPRDDPRVQACAELQPAVLLAYDEKHGTDLSTTLRHCPAAAGNN